MIIPTALVPTTLCFYVIYNGSAQELIGMGAFFAVYAVTRIVSTGSLALAIALPIATWLRHASPSVVALTTLIGALIVVRHQSNIRRLLKGEES